MKNLMLKILKFMVKILKFIIILPMMCMQPQYKYDIDKMKDDIEEMTK